MTHKQKVKLARNMMTERERREGISVWQSKAWMDRKEARRRKELNKRKKKDGK